MHRDVVTDNVVALDIPGTLPSDSEIRTSAPALRSDAAVLSTRESACASL
ncbi:hypothetical protein [Ornithinimicrobium sp. INDO-MA30-4]|nr:hypothetical protein [Ornithinimicrobium sp. INDO-MA30-4]UJH71219.1 hypothetical protein L0A91_05225 [Ornithinimicrobium sp. INDO-MA30-4]